MSSRLEKRFNQTKASQLTDPILLSGLDPSLIHELTDPTTIRDTVDSVIRAQWLQIHPDRAPSPAERQRRERAKGELEGALQVLKSAEFGECLKRFRVKFPDRVVGRPISWSDEFSSQFASLDMLLAQNTPQLPLRALRDVTIELFDLPTLARAISAELATSSSSKERELVRTLLHRSPETITLANVLSFHIGSSEYAFVETGFGKELYKRLYERLKDTTNSDLKVLRGLFSPTALDDAALRLLDKDAQRCLERSARELSSLWNRTIDSLMEMRRLEHFISHQRSIRSQSMAAEVAKLTLRAHCIPAKQLYVDLSGRFFEGSESGSLHSVRVLEGRKIIPEDEDMDESRSVAEGQERFSLAQVACKDLVRQIIHASVEQRLDPQVSHPVFRPEGNVLRFLKQECVGVQTRNNTFSHSEELNSIPQGAHSGGLVLLGSFIRSEDLFYGSEPGHLPTLPSHLLTQEPAECPADNRVSYLLTSQRTDDSGQSRFYVEGLIQRITRRAKE